MTYLNIFRFLIAALLFTGAFIWFLRLYECLELWKETHILIMEIPFYALATVFCIMGGIYLFVLIFD